jgi:DNA-directed RNA polymerase specialized sigma24 family protein
MLFLIKNYHSMVFNKLFNLKKTVVQPETDKEKLAKLWVYYKDLERFFAKRVSDPDVYKDLVVQTLSRGAYKMAQPNFVEQGKTLNFLYAIAQYILLDFYKKLPKPIPKITLETNLEMALGTNNPNYILEPVDFLNECIEKARMEVSTAMKVYVDAFENHYDKDKAVPYDDLAKQLNTSQGYVKKKVGEVKGLIRKCTLKKSEEANLYIP